MGMAASLIEVKAAVQGSIANLLLVLIAAVLAMAAAAPPDHPDA